MGTLVINNETRWETRDLRRFVAAGLKAEVGEWPGRYVVDVRTRRSRVRGRGYYSCRHMMLYVPSSVGRMVEHAPGECYPWDVDPRAKPDVGWFTRTDLGGPAFLRQLAKTLAHEVDHNNGVRGHREIDDSEREVEWVEPLIEAGFVIRLRRPRAPVRKDRQAGRAAHAEAMLAEHEAKLRREKKLVQKWRQKVRYYRKAMAARRAADGGAT